MLLDGHDHAGSSLADKYSDFPARSLPARPGWSVWENAASQSPQEGGEIGDVARSPFYLYATNKELVPTLRAPTMGNFHTPLLASRLVFYKLHHQELLRG